jgi:N-acetylglucosamine kinase-like BadF-type ATPase
LGEDVEPACRRLYNSPTVVNDVAQLAPMIVALASTGDTDAAALVAWAAKELANTASAAAKPFQGREYPLAVTGRLVAEGTLADAFAAAIAERDPAARLAAPLGDPLDGAARLASHGSPLHHSLIPYWSAE